MGGETIRLEGIDAPELGQAFGKAAKEALSGLIFGKLVEVEPLGVDRYKRTLARLYADGLPVNVEMVRMGFAWRFVRYSADSQLIAAGLFVVVGVLSWHPAFRARVPSLGSMPPAWWCDDRQPVAVVRPGFTLWGCSWWSVC